MSRKIALCSTFTRILPGMDNFQIRDADVVIAAIFLDVDGILDHHVPRVPQTPGLRTQDRGEMREVAIHVMRKLHSELGLQSSELVTDVGLECLVLLYTCTVLYTCTHVHMECLISVTWVNTNNGGNFEHLR